MTAERIFNIFIYFQEGVATEYGVRFHRISGSDDEKTAFLLLRVSEDHAIARHFKLARSFTPEEWRAALRHGDILQYFEVALTAFRAKESPLYCLTAVVDGLARIDQQIGPEPFRGDSVSRVESYGAVPDYLVHYTDGGAFRFTELINDDFFKAIKCLYNANLYVSCAKLLMSCVDTMAFVECGDVPGNFAKWLDDYVDLAQEGITSDELWEFRNSVLHMTNLASRKVLSGKVSPIMPYVGTFDTIPAISPGLPKPFSLYGLIRAVGDGIGKWAEAYNSDRDKLLKFIERYDTTISDSRSVWIPATDIR